MTRLALSSETLRRLSPEESLDLLGGLKVFPTHNWDCPSIFNVCEPTTNALLTTRC